MTGGVQGITEADIAEYLANTPGFFERHAQLLATVQLTSPHGQRAVSLQERQMEMLRDKIRGLEARFMEMIRNGQDNVGLNDRLHRWILAMMLVPQPGDLPDVLVRELKHHFMIPQAGVRLWSAAPAYAGLEATRPVGDDARLFAASLGLPYCGINSGFEAARWLEQPTEARSMALIPLRVEQTDPAPTSVDVGLPTPPATATAFGMLVLASPDPTRYAAEMGTEFLVRIGEIASAALTRLLPARG